MTKTLTFAVMHFAIGFGVVHLMTGSIALGGLVALIEPPCNTVGYFFHDRVWQWLARRSGGDDDGVQTA